MPGQSGSHPLISAVVGLFRQTRNEYLIEMLAAQVEGRGHADLAQAVRKEGSADAPDDPIST